LILLVASTSLFAQANAIYYRDIKLPSQKMVESQTWTTVAANATDNVLLDATGNTSAAAKTTSSGFLVQPDYPRNFIITPGGTTASLNTPCTVVVNGTNKYGTAIYENFVFSTTSAVTGAKAFKTITSIVWPALCENSPYDVTWSVGFGKKLGIKKCMANAGDFLFSLLAGSKEANAPTIAVNATAIESNTVSFDGTYNGSNTFALYFFQNFRCN